MSHVIIDGKKQCTGCAEFKLVSDYYLDSRRKSIRAKCKLCCSNDNKNYRINNKEKETARQKRWRDANPDKANATAKRYFEKNKEIMYQRTAEWREKNREYANYLGRMWSKNNPAKAAANASKRRAKVLKATPKWADEKEIQIEYDLANWCSKVTGNKYHVDHIIPLQGKEVSGLHVHQNLRVILAKENQIKSNKYTV